MLLSMVSILAILLNLDRQISKQEQDNFLVNDQGTREDVKTRGIGQVA
jgi:hypothetical protein